jgi:hypothetical protein
MVQTRLDFTRAYCTISRLLLQRGELLGNKASLEQHICEVTGIPASALRGSPFSDFSVAERLSWAASRETFRPEDKAYSLFGIFGIYLPLIHGEGKENALKRLRQEIDNSINGYELHNLLKPSTESLPKLRPPEKVRLCARQRRILRSIAILFSPLSATTLAKVISVSRTQVTQTLEKLQAILDVPKDAAGLLRLHHLEQTWLGTTRETFISTHNTFRVGSHYIRTIGSTRLAVLKLETMCSCWASPVTTWQK